MGRNAQARLTEFTAPLRHKLEAGHPGHPDYAELEVPLHVGFGEPSGLWLWTPEDWRGFHFRLYVEGGQESTAHLNVRLEPAGMPVGEAYANARFLQALHAGSGALVFTMLEPQRDSVTAAELPSSGIKSPWRRSRRNCASWATSLPWTRLPELDWFTLGSRPLKTCG